MAFNKLSDGQAERLAYLLEELGEAQQAIGKILRHGYESCHPDYPEKNNKDDLEKELSDIWVAIKLMLMSNDISFVTKNINKSKLKKYMHHQKIFKELNENN
jgi:NTP pyrophosphatase (non-canonical NTP hydrolase)